MMMDESTTLLVALLGAATVGAVIHVIHTRRKMRK